MVQTSQDGLGQNLMIPRNPVSGESLHRSAYRRFGYGIQLMRWRAFTEAIG